MKKIVVSGKSIDEAVKRGLAEWNVNEDRVKITVLVQPAKGLFGLFGSKDAKVELELIPDPLEEAILFLQDVCATMQVNVKIETLSGKDGTVLNLTGEDLGILIGRRGQTLDALQYLTNIVMNRLAVSHQRVILDAEQFRERRRKTLEDLSDRLAQRVVRSAKEVMLEPMPPLERKVIHSRLQDHQSVKTFSTGEEPNRRIVIALK